MASKDVDGKSLMILGEGANVALVMGDRSYQGTLQTRLNGDQEYWYIKLSVVHPGESDEIQIHKIDKPEIGTCATPLHSGDNHPRQADCAEFIKAEV